MVEVSLGFCHYFLGLYTCLVASPKSFGDYLKEKVSLFMLKMSCNYKVIHSFTILISFYHFFTNEQVHQLRVRKGAATGAV